MTVPVAGSPVAAGPAVGVADAAATIALDGPVDLVATCGALAEGRSDPVWRIGPDAVARSRHTPDGPATVELRRCGDRHLAVRAWGPGAAVAVADAAALAGQEDDRDGFEPALHPAVLRQHRRHPGLRLAAGRSVWDAAVPVVLGQRVTVGEARRSWRDLVLRYGTVAPGPLGLPLAPSPRRLRALGDPEWHVLGVERRRADAVRALAATIGAMERSARDGAAPLDRALRSLPGVGAWTATALVGRVVGDPDVVLLGDLHVPHRVCHALTGAQRGSDERMLELLAPWRGQRARVVRLVVRGLPGPARRAPRYRPIPIARW